MRAKVPAKTGDFSFPGKERGEPLRLATGYFDDDRQALGPDHALYPVAVFVRHSQDHWNDLEHEAYWVTHLALWPRRKGATNRDALAFTIVQAVQMGVVPQRAADELGYSLDDLRDRNIFDRASRMLQELRRPSLIRLPRVMTEDEYDRRPLLTGQINLPIYNLPPGDGSAIKSSQASLGHVIAGANKLVGLGGAVLPNE